MISIILPVYNEQNNIKKTIDSVLDFFYKSSLPFEIIAVNDGSHDATTNVLADYQGEKNVLVISHPKNLGYGAALRSGFNQAKGDLIFFMDSDGQFTIEDISPFLEKLPAYDGVIGYRKQRKDPYIRIVYGFILKVTALILFGVNVKDVDGAFKLFKKEVIKNMTLEENGALINLEILALAHKKGYVFLELPISHFKRVSGKSTGGNFIVIFKAMYHMLGLWKRVKAHNHGR